MKNLINLILTAWMINKLQNRNMKKTKKPYLLISQMNNLQNLFLISQNLKVQK